MLEKVSDVKSLFRASSLHDVVWMIVPARQQDGRGLASRGSCLGERALDELEENWFASSFSPGIDRFSVHQAWHVTFSKEPIMRSKWS